MEIFKWIILILLISLVTYLLIDTTIYAVKKIKAKNEKELEKKQEVNDNNDNK